MHVVHRPEELILSTEMPKISYPIFVGTFNEMRINEAPKNIKAVFYVKGSYYAKGSKLVFFTSFDTFQEVIEKIKNTVGQSPVLDDILSVLTAQAAYKGVLYMYRFVYEISKHIGGGRYNIIGEADAYVVQIELFVPRGDEKRIWNVLDDLKKKYPYLEAKTEKGGGLKVTFNIILPIATKEFESLFYSALASPTIESPTVETEEVKDEDIEEILDRLYMPILPPDVLAKLREELNKASQTPVKP